MHRRESRTYGATMASDSFSENEEADRPTVQVGDPFKEKLLLEKSPRQKIEVMMPLHFDNGVIICFCIFRIIFHF